MVNKRFLQTARRQMNPTLPEERVKVEKEFSGLTQTLERDTDGKPLLSLTPLGRTAVNTTTQDEYWDLVRVYECGGWKWKSGGLSTSVNNWEMHKEEICVTGENSFKYGLRNWYDDNGYSIISPQDFYNEQEITSEQIQEINNWFDENDREKS